MLSTLLAPPPPSSQDEFHEMVAGERAPNPAFLRRFSKQIRRTATNDFVLRGQREDDSTWERVRRESLPS